MEGCGPSFVLRRFMLTTSIRGARRTVESEGRGLRLFWASFIVLSVLAVLTAGFFCIQSYLTFDTVVQRSHEPFLERHFPAVTVCSDGFFGTNRNAHMLLAHPVGYKRLVNSLLKDALSQGDTERVQALMTLKSTVLYNVNNHWMLQPLLDSFIQRQDGVEFKNTTKKKVRPIHCSVQSQTHIGNCVMRSFTDFRYRNCITFEMPRQNVTHMAQQQQMEIVIPILTLKAPVEFAADLLHLKPLLGRFVFVFLHEVGTLPPRVPTTFVPAISYSSALINFDATLVQNIPTPPDPCHLEDQVPRVPHAGRNVVKDAWVCNQNALQKRVRRRCGCEWWGPPLGAEWAAKERRPAFCGTLRARNVTAVVQELQCLQEEESRLEGDIDNDSTNLKHCIEPCSRIHYGSSRVFQDTNEYFKYRELLNEYRMVTLADTMHKRCSKSGKKNSGCIDAFRFLQRLLVEVNTADNFPPTANSSRLKAERRERMNAERAKRLRHWLTVMPELDSRLLWWQAFPNGTHFNLSADTDFILNYQRLVLRPSSWVLVMDKHTLVRTKWMTLGQVGGAASFLAGLSLTVLAELIDACCYYRKKHRREEDAAPGERRRRRSEEREDEYQNAYWSVAENPK